MYSLSTWGWRRKLTAGLGTEEASGRWWYLSQSVKGLTDTVRTSGRVGNYLGSNKSGLASVGLGGVMGWDGKLSFACSSAVPTWGLRVPLARGFFFSPWEFGCRSDPFARRIRLGKPVQF